MYNPSRVLIAKYAHFIFTSMIEHGYMRGYMSELIEFNRRLMPSIIYTHNMIMNEFYRLVLVWIWELLLYLMVIANLIIMEHYVILCITTCSMFISVVLNYKLYEDMCLINFYQRYPFTLHLMRCIAYAMQE